MKRLKITMIVMLAVTVLVVIAAAQTRTQAPSGPVGRYQLLSTPFKWVGADAESKVVIDDTNRVFRIDTVTGETAVLQFTPDGKGNVRTFWMPVGK